VTPQDLADLAGARKAYNAFQDRVPDDEVTAPADPGPDVPSAYDMAFARNPWSLADTYADTDEDDEVTP
jgi:hypothetical protein